MSVSNEQEQKQVTAGGKFSLCISLLREKTDCKNWVFQMIPRSLSHALCGEGESNIAMPVIFVRTLDKKLPSVNIRNANLALVVQRRLLKSRV